MAKKPKKEKDKIRPSEEEVRAAFREVLGRDPDREGLHAYMTWGESGDWLKKDLAGSVEASRRKGLDHAKYGVKVKTLDELTETEKASYEKFGSKLGLGDVVFTPAVMKQLRAVEHAFRTPEAEEEFLNGNITVRMGKQGAEFTVTDRAVQRLGADLNPHLAGRQGTAWLFPTSVKLNGEDTAVTMKNKRFSDAQEIGENMPGYSYTSRIKKPGQGVFGEISGFLEDKVGMSEDLANVVTTVGAFAINPYLAIPAAGNLAYETLGVKEGMFVSDPVGLWSGLTYGTEGYNRQIEGGASVFNTSEKKFAQNQSIVKTGIKVGLNFFGPAGMLASAGMSVVDNFNEAGANRMDWGKAMIASTVDVGMAAVGGGSAWSAAGAQATGAFVKGKLVNDLSTSDAFKSAGWAAVASLAGSALGNAASRLAPATAGWQRAAGAASNLVANYGVSALRGEELRGQELAWAALQASVAGAAAARNFNQGRAQFGEDWRPKADWGRSFGWRGVREDAGAFVQRDSWMPARVLNRSAWEQYRGTRQQLDQYGDAVANDFVDSDQYIQHGRRPHQDFSITASHYTQREAEAFPSRLGFKFPQAILP